MITIIAAIPNKENVKEIANEAFYQNVEFWVGVSFILVVICLFPSAVKLIKQLINQRIERIKNDLQTAETLKLDAEKLQGEVLRLARREDVDLPVEEHLIVELYSK